MPTAIQRVYALDLFGDPLSVAVAAVAANSALCACIKAAASPSGVSCGSDALTLVDSFIDADLNEYSVWQNLSCLGGGTSVVVDFPANTFMPVLAVVEYSGVASAGPILNAQGTGTDVSEAYTTTVDNAAAFGIVGNDVDAYTLTGDAGYTVEPGTLSYNYVMFDDDVGAVGPKDFGATWGSSTVWEVIGRVYYGPAPSMPARVSNFSAQPMIRGPF